MKENNHHTCYICKEQIKDEVKTKNDGFCDSCRVVFERIKAFCDSVGLGETAVPRDISEYPLKIKIIKCWDSFDNEFYYRGDTYGLSSNIQHSWIGSNTEMDGIRFKLRIFFEDDYVNSLRAKKIRKEMYGLPPVTWARLWEKILCPKH